MLGYYNYSVILTYVSLAIAMLGMFFGLSENGLFPALICLILSGVCDMFDGAIACRCQRNEEEKMFGIQIDSLCDLVAFAVLPALLMWRLAEGSFFARIAAVLFVLSAVIRLAYFNVQETLRDRNEKRRFYTGLPVTMTALLFPAFVLIGLLPVFSFSWWMPLCLILLSAAQISRVPIPKPYGLGKLVMILIGVAVGILLIVFREYITF